MSSKDQGKDKMQNQESQKGEQSPRGYPPYPSNEDIYNEEEEEQEIDPENVTENKSSVPRNAGMPNERELDDAEYMGDDLDVPGEELDDADEEIGEEDEENNYYSLGEDEESKQ